MKNLIHTHQKTTSNSHSGIISTWLKAGVILLTLMAFIATAANAQLTITAVQSGPWGDPNTWDESIVPTSADDVIIGATYEVIVDATGAECNSLRIGVGDGSGSGSLTFSGTSSLTVTGDILVGDAEGAVGFINMSTEATLICASITESDPTYSGIYDTNYGTVIFTGSFTLPFNLFQFNNLIISGGTVTTGGRNLPIEGDLTIQAGSTLDLMENTANRNTIGGLFTVEPTGSLLIGGGGTIPANFETHSIGATSTISYYGVSQTVATLNSSQHYGNLIIDGTGLKEVNGTIEIEGDLSVNAAIFSLNTFTANRVSAGGTLTVADGATLRIAGSGTLPANFSTHSIGATSTIEYLGTSTQNVALLNSDQSYGNLTVTNNVKTLLGDTRVRGTLTFGGTPNRLNIGNNTLTIEGVVTGQTTTRTFSCSTGSEMIINGSQNRTIYFDATTNGVTNQLTNLTLNHSGYVTTMGSNLMISGNLTFTNGKLAISTRTLTLKGDVINTVTGGLRGSTSSNLVINGSTSFTLSMDQTTPNSSNALSAFTINSANQVITMGNNLYQNGTLTFTNGKLAINGNTLTFRGSVVNTVSEGLRGGSTSNLVYSGTTISPSISFDQSTPGVTNVINNFTISASGRTVTLLNALRLVGTHTPTNGVLASNGNYTIASTAGYTANVAAGSTSGGYITGDVIVERYIPQNANRAWRLLASPTSGQTIKQAWQEDQPTAVDGNPGYGTIITNNEETWSANGFDYQTPYPSIYRYEQSTDELVAITNTGDFIDGEQGYFMYIRGSRSVSPSASITAMNSTVLRTTGSLYTGNQAAITVPADKFAIVGNPYASALDIRNITKTGGLTNTAFYVWDPKLQGSYDLGAYQTLVPDGGNYIVVPGGGSYGSTGSVVNTIQSGAAFFVQASGTSGDLTILESSKTAGSSVVFRPTTPTDANEARFITNLYAVAGANKKLADGNAVFFGSSYTSGIDGLDSKKMINFGENLSMLRGAAELVIERRPSIAQNDTIFYSMYQMKRTTYQMEFIPSNFEQNGTTAILIDKYLNTQTAIDLSDTSYYSFALDANAGSRVEDRFKLVFKPANVLPVTFTEVRATQQQNNIAVEWTIENQLNIQRYEVEKSTDGRNFSTVGQVAATGNVRSTANYNWLDTRVSAGNNYYRVKSVDANGAFKYTQIVKVYIGKGTAAITVLNNPVQGSAISLQFNEQAKGAYQIKLSNVAGQQVLNKSLQYAGGNGTQSFAIPASIAKGIYHLEIVSPDNTRQVQKLFINR